MIAAIGMGATVSDLTYLGRRPGLLIRSVVAMYLLVPLSALLLMAVLPVSIAVKVALLVIAISAGAPLIPRKLMGFDTDAYGFSLVATSSLLAVLTVPAWHAALASIFDVSTELTSTQVARLIATTFLIPLVTGMILRRIIPFVDDRLSDRILKVCGAVLSLAGIALLIMHREILSADGWPLFGSFAIMALIALAIGHLSGGPEADDRAALAVACATRHLGIAIMVAASLPGPRSSVLVAAYILVSAGISIPYLRWQKKRIARSEA